MSHTLRNAVFFTIAILFAVGASRSTGQGIEKKLKSLDWSHAFDLACRKERRFVGLGVGTPGDAAPLDAAGEPG